MSRRLRSPQHRRLTPFGEDGRLVAMARLFWSRYHQKCWFSSGHPCKATQKGYQVQKRRAISVARSQVFSFGATSAENGKESCPTGELQGACAQKLAQRELAHGSLLTELEQKKTAERNLHRYLARRACSKNLRNDTLTKNLHRETCSICLEKLCTDDLHKELHTTWASVNKGT